MNTNELFQSMEIVQTTAPIINRMSHVGAGSIVCMIAEEWCKANHTDVIDFMNQMAEMVSEVNQQLGRY